MRQMRMRASLLGGTLELRDDGRNQTVLELILPLVLKRETETTDFISVQSSSIRGIRG